MVDKSIVGNTAGGVVHLIYLDLGPIEAGNFLSNS